MITALNIYRRGDGSLTFRPGRGRDPAHVVLACRRNPALRVPVSEASDVAIVKGHEMTAAGVVMAARARWWRLRLWREGGRRVARPGREGRACST